MFLFFQPKGCGFQSGGGRKEIKMCCYNEKLAALGNTILNVVKVALICYNLNESDTNLMGGDYLQRCEFVAQKNSF